MCGHVLCLATALVGLDTTFQPLPDGQGTLYWIQIEPGLLATLQAGEPLESYIPPRAGQVRAFRITMGSGELPVEVPPPAQARLPDPVSPTPPDPIDPALPPPDVPGPFQPDPGSQHIDVHQAGHSETIDMLPSPPSGPNQETTVEDAPEQADSLSEESSRPWALLTLTLFGLFASLGANGFLVWVATDFRRRYRALVARVIETAGE